VRQASREQTREELVARLRTRLPEIEGATLTRVYAVADLPEGVEPEYAEGLRAAVPAALDYALSSIEHGEKQPPPIPTALLAQARLSARSNVNFDIVLRRYLAGYTLLTDFVIEEVEQGDAPRGPALKRMLRAQSVLFDRLVRAVSDEYARASKNGAGSAEEHRAECVQRILAGELLDASELDYDLEAHHLGAIASGPGAAEAVRSLAQGLGRRLLLVSSAEGTLWAWLGSRRRIDRGELGGFLSSNWPADASLALGEPGKGIGGWRLTHHQAAAAFSVSLHSSERVVRYADVAILALTLKDDLLATSLRRLYLDPLEGGRDGGTALRETLRTYIKHDLNVSSTAAALGVGRRTVKNRLRAAEEQLGRSLSANTADIEVTLRLASLKEVW
jgi:hypothetical protein